MRPARSQRAAPRRLPRWVVPGSLMGIAALAAAAVPSVIRITPAVVASAGATPITIEGAAFEPGARVSLLAGGPFLAGSYFLPEGARNVQVHGTHATVAFYSHVTKLGGIQILDIADPAAPVRLGSFETGDSGVAVQMAGPLAYVAFLNPYTFLGGMHVVDMTDPLDPIRVGTFDVLLDPQTIALAGTHAYAADGGQGLIIIDISDPAHPFEAGRFDTPGTPRDVKVQGGLAYVADGEAGLLVLDVSDPGAPVPLGGFAEPGGIVTGVALDSGRAYLSDQALGLLVLDLADPGRPLLLGRTPISDGANAVEASGRYAYVAAGYSGLQVVDVSDPSRPRVVGSAGPPGSSSFLYTVALQDGRVWSADLINGIHVIDVSRPASPSHGEQIALAGTTQAVSVEADHAFVARGEAGVASLGLTPGLSLLAELDTPGEASGVWVQGARLHVADGAAGLLVLDVSDPLAPVELGRLDTPGDALAVAVSGDRAFVADGSRGLRIVDVASPAHPVELGSFDTPGTARGISLSAGLAYVADDFRGITILDVSNPMAPAFLSRHDTPGRAVGVAAADGFAYVADLNRGLQIIDVGNPVSPAPAASYSTPGAATGVALDGDRLYVADAYGGLLELDVADPRHPRLTGRFDTPGSAAAAAFTPDGGLVVADGAAGARRVRPEPALAGPSSVQADRIEQIVPEGLPPGPHDLLVTNPAGETHLVENGIQVCGRAGLDARLAVVSHPAGGPAAPASGRYRLEVVPGPDAVPGDPPRGWLLLPALAETRVFLLRREKEAIQIDLDGSAGGAAGVVLSGPDPDRLRAVWDEAVSSGGFALPRDQEGGFAPIGLSLLPAASAAGKPGGSPRRYLYELEEGSPTRARAWGSGADLLFAVLGTDPFGCEASGRVSFAESQSPLLH